MERLILSQQGERYFDQTPIPAVRNAHGDNMGPTWGRQDPGGPHVGHMNFAIWGGMIIVPHGRMSPDDSS